MKQKKDLFTEDELKQVKKEEIEALKRALIIGATTSILTAIAVLIIAAWLGWL